VAAVMSLEHPDHPGLPDLAGQCAARSLQSKTLQPRARAELTSIQLSLILLGKKKDKLIPETIMVHQQAIKRLDSLLGSFVRLEDAGGIQDLCILMWNAGLLLLQRNLRKSVQQPFASGLTALENIASPLHRLRVLMHLELAWCYMAEDMLTKADKQVAKALVLDYTASKAEQDQSGYTRPLDYFLLPLQKFINLKTSIYDTPEGGQEQALLLVEQAKEATQKTVKADVLQRAVEKLEVLEPVLLNAEGMTDDEKFRAKNLHRERSILWGEIVKVAWGAKLAKLTHQVAGQVLAAKWDTVNDKAMVLLQAEVSLIDAEACVALLLEKDVEPVPVAVLPAPPPEEDEEDEDEDAPPALVHGSREELQTRACTGMVDSMKLGSSIGESWIVMNAGISGWNYYIHLVKAMRYAELHALWEPLFEGLQALADVDQGLLCNFADTLACCWEHKFLMRVAPEGSSMNYRQLAPPKGELAMGTEELEQAIKVCDGAIRRAEPQFKRRLVATLARLKAVAGQGPPPAENGQGEEINRAISCIEVLLQTDGSAAANTRQDALTGAVQALESAAEVDVQLWSKLAKGALAMGEYASAISAAQKAVSTLPEDVNENSVDELEELQPDQEKWFWLAVAEVVHGKGLVALLRPELQDHHALERLKQKALEHFVNAILYGVVAGPRKDVVDHAARCLWNTSMTFMQSRASRAMLLTPLRKGTHLLRRVRIDPSLRANLYYCLLQVLLASQLPAFTLPSLNTPFQGIGRERRGVSTEALLDANMWEEGLSTAETALRNVPMNMQLELWELKAEILSKSLLAGHGGQGKKPQGNVFALDKMETLKDHPEQFQAKVWAYLAANSPSRYEQFMAHKNAVDVLEGQPQLQVEYMVEFGIWMYDSGQPAEDTQDMLLTASEILMDPPLEETNPEDQDDDDSRSVRSRTSTNSKVSRSTSRTNKKKALGGRSPSKRGSTGGSPHRGSRDSRIILGEGPAEDEDKQSNEKPPEERVTSVKQMQFLIRIFVMLAKLAGTTTDKTSLLLVASHFSLKMLNAVLEPAAFVEESLKENADGNVPEAPPEAPKEEPPETLPSSLEEWTGFSFSEQMQARLQANTGDLAFTGETIGRPEMFLRINQYIQEELCHGGYHLHAVPVGLLGCAVAQVMCSDTRVKEVAHLQVAAVLTELNLTDDARRHFSQGGAMSLQEAEMKNGRKIRIRQRDHEQRANESEARYSSALGGPSCPLQVLTRFEDHKIWAPKGRYLARLGEYGPAKEFLEEALDHAKAFADEEAQADCILVLAQLEHLVNNPKQAVALLQQGQQLRMDFQQWARNLSLFVCCKLEIRDGWDTAKECLEGAISILKDKSTAVDQDGGEVAGRPGLLLESTLASCCMHLELSRIMMKKVEEEADRNHAAEDLYHSALGAATEAMELVRAAAGPLLVEAGLNLASMMARPPPSLQQSDPRENLQAVRAVLLQAQAEATRIFTGNMPLGLASRVSLPIARQLAAVEAALVQNLLQHAAANRELEASDLRDARPGFPSKDGIDSSPIEAFLDMTQEHVHLKQLKPGEEAVLHASKAVNLTCHPRQRVQMLYLLGRSLADLHNVHCSKSVWVLPSPPPAQEDGDPEAAAVAAAAAPAEAEAVDMKPEVSGESASDNVDGSRGSAEAVEPAEEVNTEPVPYKEQACSAWQEAMSTAFSVEAWQVAETAAIDTAHICGKVESERAAEHVILAQSLRVRMKLEELLFQALGPHDRERLLFKQREHLKVQVNARMDSHLIRHNTKALEEFCPAWPMLQLRTPVMEMIEKLPEKMRIISLYVSADQRRLYVACMRSPAEDEPPKETKKPAKGEVPVELPPPPPMAIVDCVDINPEALERLRQMAQQYTRTMEKLITTQGPPPPMPPMADPEKPDAELPPPPEAVFITPKVKKGLAALLAEMEAFFEPIKGTLFEALSPTHIEDAPPMKLTLLVDELLAPLPLEQLKSLRTMSCIARDFSLHTFFHRVNAREGMTEKGPPATAVGSQHFTYLADLRGEDSLEVPQPAPRTLPLMHDVFKWALLEQYGKDWHGLQGTSGQVQGEGLVQKVPSTLHLTGPRDDNPLPPCCGHAGALVAASRGNRSTKVQYLTEGLHAMLHTKVMSNARALVYFGMGRLLGYVPHTALSVSLEECHVALLVDCTSNEHVYRRQQIANNMKLQEELALENPYETAALLSLRGVTTIVTNQLPAVVEDNFYFLFRLFQSFAAGGLIGDLVKAAASSEEQPDYPRPQTPKGGKSAGGGKGKEKGKGATPRQIEEPPEPIMPVNPYRAMNPVIYGLSTLPINKTGK
ncbi:hypothetical protein CYMTET_25118, partial [Cymbomonas tetramitiformis]